jgi:5'-nucleotidase
MEGLALGVPAIAVSFAGRQGFGSAGDFQTIIDPLADLLRHLTSLPAFPADTLFNVNIPPVPAGEIRGTRLTRLSRRVFSDSIAKMKDPWGKPIYWIGGGSVTWTTAGEGTDIDAVRNGFISVTPLHLDITNQARLADADRWWTAP